MSNMYNHKQVEKKWRKVWEKTQINETDLDLKKPKAYCLDMFPYPSGTGLHVGHPKGYIATDVYSRMKKLQGYRILHPMGWDAFGLPAENYALQNKIHPRVAVEKNIVRFKEQLKKIGFNYDWSREINTIDPEYYKWTQWIFLKLLEKGLAYESYEPIIWCVNCKTGLALEDLEGGKCERCGGEVEKRPMRQWVLKMTDYADRLLEDLDKENLDWEEQIKGQQRNWIGRSEGVQFKLKVKSKKLKVDEFIEVFTTRIDTVYGMTYVVLAPESKIIESLKTQIKNWEEVEKYIDKANKKTDLQRMEGEKEKTGVKLEGLKAVNPFNNVEIPIFIADYVLGGYGTGAVMAVPAHDERDYEFAKKYDLPIIDVIMPVEGEPHKDAIYRKNILVVIQRKSDGKFLHVQWKKFDWTAPPIGGVEEDEDPMKAAEREILEETGYKTKAIRFLGGQFEGNFYAANKKIWRQTHCQPILLELVDEKQEEVSDEEKSKHDAIWLTGEEALKKITHSYNKVGIERYLKNNDSFTGYGKLIDSDEFTGLTSDGAKKKMVEWLEKKKLGGRKINYKMRDWVFSRQRYWGEPIPVIHCEKCGVVPVPEKDLPLKLPEVEQYEPTGTGESPLANIEEWVNVECPKCGGKGKRETNTMPQWAGSSWYYLRYIDPKNDKALVDKEKEKNWMPVDLYVGGIEHATRHLLYARFWHKFLYDIGVVSTKEPFKRLIHVGLIMAEDERKMSKRWNNVINPDDMVENFGADSLRVYEMFMGPFTQSIAWSTDGMKGARKFLDKVWNIAEYHQNNGWTESSNISTARELNKTIKKVGEDIASFKFNTAISSLMVFANHTFANDTGQERYRLSKGDFEKFLLILSPFSPFITEELWQQLGNTESIHVELWPAYDKDLIQDEVVTVAIQINGKVRDELAIGIDWEEEFVLEKAKESTKVQKYLEGKEIKKVIYIQGKLLSLVVS